METPNAPEIDESGPRPAPGALSGRFAQKDVETAFGQGRYNHARTEDTSTVLTAEKRTMIVGLVRRGLPRKYAAQVAGILPDTVEKALTRGKADMRECEDLGLPMTAAADFASKLLAADGRFKMDLHDKYMSAMEKDPRAAVAYLELLGRLHPTDLGRRQVVKVEQDTTLRIAWVEKDGEEWQRGQARASVAGVETPALEAGPSVGNDIIDAEIRAIESDDDNEF